MIPANEPRVGPDLYRGIFRQAADENIARLKSLRSEALNDRRPRDAAFYGRAIRIATVALEQEHNAGVPGWLADERERKQRSWPDCPTASCDHLVHDCQCRGSDLDEREGVV